MAVSNDFIDYVLDQYLEWGGVTARKMWVYPDFPNDLVTGRRWANNDSLGIC